MNSAHKRDRSLTYKSSSSSGSSTEIIKRKFAKRRSESESDGPVIADDLRSTRASASEEGQGGAGAGEGREGGVAPLYNDGQSATGGLNPVFSAAVVAERRAGGAVETRPDLLFFNGVKFAIDRDNFKESNLGSIQRFIADCGGRIIVSTIDADVYLVPSIQDSKVVRANQYAAASTPPPVGSASSGPTIPTSNHLQLPIPPPSIPRRVVPSQWVWDCIRQGSLIDIVQWLIDHQQPEQMISTSESKEPASSRSPLSLPAIQAALLPFTASPPIVKTDTAQLIPLRHHERAEIFVLEANQYFQRLGKETKVGFWNFLKDKHPASFRDPRGFYGSYKDVLDPLCPGLAARNNVLPRTKPPPSLLARTRNQSDRILNRARRSKSAASASTDQEPGFDRSCVEDGEHKLHRPLAIEDKSTEREEDEQAETEEESEEMKTDEGDYAVLITDNVEEFQPDFDELLN